MPDVRAELLAMEADDQADRAGPPVSDPAGPSEHPDMRRAARLGELIDEHGWLSPGLVNEDGTRAAWLIAQHADDDVAFQERVLALMRGDASTLELLASEVALLTDRVAVNNGREQTYGSQGHCIGGKWTPRPIAEADQVDDRRAEVGLEPLADYIARFDGAC